MYCDIRRVGFMILVLQIKTQDQEVMVTFSEWDRQQSQDEDLWSHICLVPPTTVFAHTHTHEHTSTYTQSQSNSCTESPQFQS